jgi:hypothetical protein
MTSPIKDFESMLNAYVNNNFSHELEVNFNTKKWTKSDYLKIIKRLIEFGYVADNPEGEHLLRINIGNYVRKEIDGMVNIQSYCATGTFIGKNIKKESIVKRAEFPDMGYNISYKSEIEVESTNNETINNYRYLNRIKLRLKDSPVVIDASIIYTSTNNDFMTGDESYEIEIELENNNEYDYNINNIKQWLRQSILHIMCGIQQSNYPISIKEQETVLNEYNKLTMQSEFIGPSSVTLDHTDIELVSSNNFAVTDKADGERGLLFVSKNGNIYIISSQLEVKYTGKKCPLCPLTILDGELILRDKEGRYINLFAVFDAYFIDGKNIRNTPFMKNRYTEAVKAVSSIKQHCELNIQCKTFTYLNETDFKKICIETLHMPHIYHTDGLIFTHTQMYVGANEIGKEGPMHKTTWKYSFKWKPVDMNTIDFLVYTIKDKNNKDIISEGIYKQCVLNIGYDESKDGELNPMLTILGVKHNSRKGYINQPFYPTNPYDTSASRANVVLRNNQMYAEDGQIFYDGDIVEFRYEINEKRGFQWKPLRVRYDKTSELKKYLNNEPNSKPNYGNAYKVANSVWSSIHNPISFDVVSETEINDDIYYIKTDNSKRRGITKEDEGLRDFHNLYVKNRLIVDAASQFDKPILIDFACGKGGDISKWIAGNFQFVFGVDYSHDNIANKVDGIYARLLDYNKKNKNKHLNGLFACADSSKPLLDANVDISGISNTIINVVLKGVTPPDEWTNVGRYKGIGFNKFNVSSCQFAIHYFAESEESMNQFLTNVSNNTKIGGLFIGTCYDGELVYNKLVNKPLNHIESFGSLLYIQKQYEDNELHWGMEINVKQQSIGQFIKEWLVPFELLTNKLRMFGFEPVKMDRFMDLYNNMTNEQNVTSYGKAAFMSDTEKDVSFLNRAFCYVKVRELGDSYDEPQIKLKLVDNMFVKP